MLRQMIYTQWKWSRMELGVYAVLGFVIPTFVMKVIAGTAGATATVIPISALLSGSAGTGVALATLAFACAVSTAVRPWTTDQARGHVFALSLPVRWSEFVRLRFTAGAALLLIPTAAVWFGGALAGLLIPIPATLHVYPASVAARFFSCALVLYAAVFALQHIAGRRAAIVAALTLIAWATLELTTQALGLGSVSARAWTLISSWPGPFEVLTARWMLVDV